MEFRAFFSVLLFCAIVKELNCAPKKLCNRLSLKNGRVRYRPKTFAQFSCGGGYLLLGDRYSKCINGAWDNPAPVCIKASCKVPKPPQFGMIYPSYWNALVRFFCNAGYEVNGPHYAYCDGDRWSTHMPSCLPSNVTASVSCDFETPDICGWTHDLNHNFDWERLNHKTPSGHVGTGPKFDHTIGENGSGYYMYIESSTRNHNDTARLISPVYKKQSKDTCLEFYYHMYGSGIGDLRVYAKRFKEPWMLNPEKAVFNISGNQGDEWFRGFVEIGTIDDDDFQIIFEGVRGVSYVSDIAIDDVRLIEDCTPESTTITFTSEDYTNSPVVFESCENRCFKTTNQTVGSCGCDEDCFDNNSCCADFSSVCILDNSTDSTDDTTYDETTIQPTIPTIAQTTSKQTRTTQYIRTTQSTTKFATTTTTAAPITSRPTPEPTKYKIPSPTTTSTTRRTTPTKTTRRTTPTKTTRRTTPTKTTSRTTARPSTTTMDVVGTPKRIKYIDDVVPFSAMATEEVFVVETTSLEPLLSERVTPEKPSNVGTVKVVIGVVVGVMLLLGAVFLAKKANVRRCVSRNMRNNNGDSQSDVRFLTSDEMLDFTVAKPSREY